MTIFLNENHYSLIQISLKFVPNSLIDTKAAMVQVMAWSWEDNKPLPEPVSTKFLDAIRHH